MTNEIKHVYFGNLTVKRGEDGYLRVKGLATDDTLDLDEQICDPEWLKTAMPKWMEIGNIREMHGAKAVGKAVEMEQSGNGFIVEAKIVDKDAALKVEEDIYTGFSVGIKNARVVKDAAAPGGRIVSGQIVEVSLVDRPANPSAVIEIAKSVDGELVKGSAVSDEIKFAEGATLNAEAEMIETPLQNAEAAARDKQMQPCNACGGTGFKGNVAEEDMTSVPCENCHGTGVQPEHSNEDIIQSSPTQPANADDANHDVKGADAEVEKKDYSDKERQALADAGQALPDGSFPVKTVADLKNAIQSYGRAKDKDAAKKHIIARAKALGKEDLIPDNWKGADADLTKADNLMHDPADLVAVRASLIALIKAELDEMLAGTENEVADVTQLLCTLSMFLDWWTSEASENETDAPFTGWDMDNKEPSGDDMAYIGLGVSADLIKAAAADTASDTDKTALRDEIRKALGVDEEIATYKAALTKYEEDITVLKGALDEIREMAAPGGPALRQTTVQATKSAKAEALRIEAEGLRYKAAQITEPNLRNEYLATASRLERQADQA